MADDRNAPATKGDIEDLRSEMKEQIATVRSEMQESAAMLRSEMQESAAMLRSEMQHIQDELVERISDAETRLLDAFYSFAKTNQARQSAMDQETAALKERLAILEGRVTDVERRLNTPPTAA